MLKPSLKVTGSAECVINYCIDELVDASHLAIEKDSRAATYASFELCMQVIRIQSLIGR